MEKAKSTVSAPSEKKPKVAPSAAAGSAVMPSLASQELSALLSARAETSQLVAYALHVPQAWLMAA